MKTIFMSLVLLAASVTAHAQDAETRTELTRIDSSSAALKILTGDNTNQAAMYVDGSEIKPFIEMIAKDNKTQLGKLKVAIESLLKKNELDGEVYISNPLVKSFSRLGISSANARYLVTVGYSTFAMGKASETKSSLLVEVSESLQASSNHEGAFVKTYKIERIQTIR